MDSDRKKQLRAQYMQRTVTGGVCRIVNTQNGRYLLFWDDDIKGAENRHNFSVMTGSCVLPDLANDWKEFGAKSFVFEILEQLEKKTEQTQKDFRDDLELLYELWKDRFDPSLSCKKL